ncbi:MAG: signal peptidase I [Candidatus Poriferisodalaceae bacterium]
MFSNGCGCRLAPRLKYPQDHVTTPNTYDRAAAQNAFDVHPGWDYARNDVLPQQALPAKTPLRSTLEWGAVIIGALIAALIIKTFLFQAYYIPSSSMTETLHVRDRILVNKLSYQFGNVDRFDVIVFHKPDNAPQGDIQDFIKRVVGLPGETIHAENGVVFVDGVALNEPYLRDDEVTLNLPPTVVPDGHYFVMGDNRQNSSDSRVFGAIDQELIVGEAFIRVWPPSQFGGL